VFVVSIFAGDIAVSPFSSTGAGEADDALEIVLEVAFGLKFVEEESSTVRILDLNFVLSRTRASVAFSFFSNTTKPAPLLRPAMFRRIRTLSTGPYLEKISLTSSSVAFQSRLEMWSSRPSFVAPSRDFLAAGFEYFASSLYFPSSILPSSLVAAAAASGVRKEM